MKFLEVSGFTEDFFLMILVLIESTDLNELHVHKVAKNMFKLLLDM